MTAHRYSGPWCYIAVLVTQWRELADEADAGRWNWPPLYAQAMREAAGALEAQLERARQNPVRLVGKHEIAQQFGVSTQRINELDRTDPTFPAAVARLAMGPVFDQDDIDAFRASAPRRPGGRPRRW